MYTCYNGVFGVNNAVRFYGDRVTQTTSPPESQSQGTPSSVEDRERLSTSTETSSPTVHQTPPIAALDLGSNSFHMVIAHEDNGEVRPLEKRGEKVRLAAGLDENNLLSEEAQMRGLECLRLFASRIAGLPIDHVSVLATNALRRATNRKTFIDQAEKVLGYPISVISGREEARLIYKGVAHTTADPGGKRLVIDIGGGSTEFIIGSGFTPIALESLHMGCVSFTQRYFPDGKLTDKSFKKAITAAKQELLNIAAEYRAIGWEYNIGSSGTVRAIERVCTAHRDDGTEGISYECLKELKSRLIKAGHIDQFEMTEIKASRKPTLAAGLAILIASFESLNLDYMSYAEGALREGALYELLGKTEHDDVQTRTIRALQERFHVNTAHANRVTSLALALLEQSRKDWSLQGDYIEECLKYAAEVHEIGLAIAHSQFHKHGAYIISVADMLGFTRQTQQLIAFLVRVHRRKLSTELAAELPLSHQPKAIRLAILLRLAVIAHHAHDERQVPTFDISINGQHIQLIFHEAIDERLPLAYSDFLNEIDYLAAAGYQLELKLPINE